MSKRRALRIFLVLAAVLLLGSSGLSAALHFGWGRRPLLARLSASFGRPVNVASFDFSLLNGLELEAHGVTVGEDPRFGAEYFLRADQLTASPRWSQLLRGRFELGTVSIANASLNLVRAADGHWNIESWLPAPQGLPGTAAGSAAQPPQPAVRVAHIAIDTGRINFKRGVEKLPFALVGVSGRLDRDDSGRWSIDLEAIPARASVELQEAGTLYLRGTVAGTSARLRPAALTLSWADASAADAIRLASGTDYGVRGTTAGEISAAIADAPAAAPNGGWTITGALRLTGMHRWDLPAKDSDPAVNLKVTATWRSSDPGLRLVSCVVEAPHSHLNATGELNWLRGFSPSLQLTASELGLADLLAWRSAFFPGLAPGLATDGTVGVEAAMSGWPPRIEQLKLESQGATLHAGALAEPIRFGHMQAALQNGVLVLKPVPVQLPGAAVPAARGTRTSVPNPPPAPPSGALQVAAQLGPFRPGDWPNQWSYRVTVAGETARVEDLLDVAAAFGRVPGAGWTLEGSAALQLAWAGGPRQGAPETLGTLKLRGLKYTSVLLNQPLIFSSATVELRPGAKLLKVDAAQGLGAHWKGSLGWSAATAGWSFDLSADRLDAAELDQWLGPRSRPGFFARLLPFGASADLGPPREAALGQLQARGRLRIADLAIAQLHVAGVDADVQLDGRKIVVRRAESELYGGRMTGEFTAQLTATPTYSLSAKLDRVNLAALTAATPSLAGRFAGLASGDLTLTAQGISSGDLQRSLAGDGALRVRDVVLRGIDFAPEAQDVPPDRAPAGPARFSLATANFHVAAGHVHLDEALLSGRDANFELSGDVDFARRLDVKVLSAAASGETQSEPDSDAGRDSWQLGGTLDAPQVTRPTRVARARAGLPSTRR